MHKTVFRAQSSLIRAGRGMGSFLGGYLMALFGPTVTMRAMGVGSGVCGLLYGLVFYTCLRGNMKRRQQRQRQKGRYLQVVVSS